jgi:hypothetical protein
MGELIARKVEDFKTFIVVFLIEVLKPFVLRGEQALGGRVDKQKDLSLIFLEDYLFFVSCLDGDLINAHMPFLSFIYGQL